MHFINSDAFYFILIFEFVILNASEEIEFQMGSRHTKKSFFITMFYEKKGTFDFINPHFTNLYHKNSSNSTDFH